jgi:hypothetical protein
LYYAWRFHAIRAKAAHASTGATPPRDRRIAQQEREFAARRGRLAREKESAGAALAQVRRREQAASMRLQHARMANVRFGTPIDAQLVAEHEANKRDVEQKQAAYDRTLARVDTAADDSQLAAAIGKYDRMLLDDARQIVEWMRSDRSLTLRPHYSALVESYLDEYERGSGLHPQRDTALIELFEHYVHDSLAGFDTDETWPSDPRIIYVGGDKRLRYAFDAIDGDGRSRAA